MTDKENNLYLLLSIKSIHFMQFNGILKEQEIRIFSNFFAKEVKKNKHKPKFNKKDILQRKKVHCMTYSNNLYKDCYFYWHNRTSAHNKKLCSVATWTWKTFIECCLTISFLSSTNVTSSESNQHHQKYIRYLLNKISEIKIINVLIN